MLRKTRSDQTMKRLAVAGGEGFKTEYLFGGALAVIILGALALAIYFGFAGGPSASKGEVGGPWYKCEKCGEEFQLQQTGGGTMEKALPVDCPKCGGKACAYRMSVCPKCGKRYVSDTTRYYLEMMQGRAVKDICPHCGTDIGQLRREEYKKRRRK